MQPSKIQLRTRLLNERNALPTLGILRRSNEIIARLQELPIFDDASTILTYISFGTEVNTHGLIKSLLADENREVLVPVVADRKRHTLILVALHNWTDLCTGTYGILEPIEQVRTPRPPADVDFCLVPGLAFDVQGNRVGYGGGYFDRLLQTVKGHKAGIAYDFQVLDQVPCEKHDERVDMVLTDRRFITCK
jgi:5-formyltetrahydrofolate cyclo-ligase